MVTPIVFEACHICTFAVCAPLLAGPWSRALEFRGRVTLSGLSGGRSADLNGRKGQGLSFILFHTGMGVCELSFPRGGADARFVVDLDTHWQVDVGSVAKSAERLRLRVGNLEIGSSSRRFVTKQYIATTVFAPLSPAEEEEEEEEDGFSCLWGNLEVVCK
ncbi:hypothetical protein T492DRAFT_847321 [Pavlovales sp. CCMP2436]|nr:hypothetical protein T492DRAFT_847321 [Pavlovales sp. CCMP2436]